MKEGMEYQNVTLAVRIRLLRRAEKVARRRHVTLSDLMEEFLDRMVNEEENYQKAQEFCLSEMEKGYDIGMGPGPYPREELHRRD